ncbi:DUF927 domain-containing protein [Streptomyces shenzhenensis]|uniref:DUF927 domain-containing protein n=1 Tax=Streptomyces shenzhenensis TaxID=943815 RepID=UPI001F19B073|nr:DUF927 domain-containing protein [Streptomyces shenzhenensis]
MTDSTIPGIPVTHDERGDTGTLAADPQLVRAWLTSRVAAHGLTALCSKDDWTGIQTNDLDEAVDWALGQDRKGVEGIYCRVTTVSGRFPKGARGKAADSAALFGMWSDIDFGNDLHKATGLPANADEARDVPRFAKLSEPTRVEHSGAGLYVWHEFDRPVIIGDDISQDDAVRLASDWQRILLAGAKKMGVGYGTGVKDLARVLRLPGTVNRKPNRTPVLCRVVENSGPRYTLEQVRELAERLAPKPKKRTPPKPVAPRGERTTAASSGNGRGPLEILGEHECCGEILAYAGATYAEQFPGICSYCGPDCQRWYRPGWQDGCSKDGIAVHKGGAAVTVRTDNFPRFPDEFLNKVLSGGQLFAALHHGGDESAAAKDIMRAAHGRPEATPAACALPGEVLAEIRTETADKGSGRHLRAVPPGAGKNAPSTDGANALADDSAEGDDQPPAPEVGFDFTSFGLPPTITTPTGYRVNSGGVAVKRVIGKDNEVWVRFTFAPFVLTASFEDPDGNQFVELSWFDHSKGTRRIVSRVISREISKRGRELVKQLGGAGLPAVEGDARLLERWLAEFEAANVGRIPSKQLARWLGWQPDGGFISSPDDGVTVDVTYEEMRGPAKAHTKRGTLDGWKAAVEVLEKFEVPRVAVAAAFAAPLLQPLGADSFTLDISSRSTGGKTTSLQCALSVWANPSVQSDAMSNWRTTLYAIEKRLNLVRGLPTVFDETMAVTDEGLIDEVLYQVPMNHGKARSGGAYGSMLPWQTILLSSGERAIQSFTTSQGAAPRVLGTTVPPFGRNGGEAAVRARDGVLANFGHAGPAFIDYILGRLDSPGGVERLRDWHKNLQKQFRGDNDMTARRAPMVAALALGEALAARAGLLPYEPLSVEQWNKLFTAFSPTDNRPEMAMDVVREYLAAHAWELYGAVYDGDRPPFRGWLGAAKHVKGETKIAVLPQRLKGILSEAGYSLDAVLGGWLEAGYLEQREKQRPPHLIPTRVDGRVVKCFVFVPHALADDEAAGEAL